MCLQVLTAWWKNNDILLKNKQNKIIKAAQSWYEDTDLPDLQERRCSWFFFQREVSHTRSEIYCRVIQKIKLEEINSVKLYDLAIEDLSLQEQIIGKEHLDKYLTEIKQAILSGNSKPLHSDYQTLEITEQLVNLHTNLDSPNHETTKYFSLSSEERNAFIKAKINHLLTQRSNSTLINDARTHLTTATYHTKKFIREIVSQAEKNGIHLSDVDKNFINELVCQILNAYLNFVDKRGHTRVFASEILRMLVDEELGGHLDDISRTAYIMDAFYLACQFDADGFLSERHIALQIINDKENLLKDIPGAGEELRFSAEKFRRSALIHLLLQATLPYKSYCTTSTIYFNDKLTLELLTRLQGDYSNNKLTSEEQKICKKAVSILRNSKEQETIRYLNENYASLMNEVSNQQSNHITL